MMEEQQTPRSDSPVISQETGVNDSTSPPDGGEGRREAPKLDPLALTPRGSSRPVLLYIGIMFSVALFLLLLSFLMQQRNHQDLMEGITDLRDVQSIVDMKIENQTLQETLAKTKLDLAALQTEYESMTAEKNTAAAQTTAMEYLAEIRHAYDLNYRKNARELIAAFESTGLMESLPDTSAVEGEKSPAQVFLDIKNALS